jgi:3-isopropylmalate/(R)-2-methylmalate dehydratase large subunit
MLMHEVTSAPAFDTLRERKLSVFDPLRCLATLDHSIPTRPDRHKIYDEAARIQVEGDALQLFAAKVGWKRHGKEAR